MKRSTKQVIVEMDVETASRLERVAPSRSRRRSAFIRRAIRQALDEVVERDMAEAYRKQPDHSDAYLDATVWEPRAAARSPRRRKTSP